MNQQREVIYKKRRHALHGDKLSLDISNMIYDTCESIVDQAHEAKDFENFKLDLIRFLASDSSISKEEFNNLNSEEIIERTYSSCYKSYQLKSENIAQKAFPVIKDVHEKQSATYENIVIPFTDGMKTLQVVTNLKESVEQEGRNIGLAIEKSVTLAIIDDNWKEHLREMDELKQSVQNAVYEQKDPLLIYKFESFKLFKTFIDKVNKEIVSFLLKSELPIQSNVQEEKRQAQTNLQTSRPEMVASTKDPQNQPSPQKTQPVRVEQKVGRNEPCPCGSGKKYKKCHGR